MPTPAVSRAVHYVSYGTPAGEYSSQCRAATITEVGAWMPYLGEQAGEDRPVAELAGGRRMRTLTQVWEPEACALTVSNPTGLFFNTCLHDETKAAGTWHWPERVGD